jgi:AraC-like DNA-binding protein
MPRHSTAALILLLDALRRAGENPTPALARFGLDAERLDPTELLDESVELRVNSAIAEAVCNPLAGLRAGTGLGIASYGPFTLLLLTCRDALDAGRTAVEYQALTFLLGQLSFRPGRARSALVLSLPPLHGPALRFRIDLEVAGTWRLMRDIHRAAGADMGPDRIVMPYPAPDQADAYTREFGCRVDWGGRNARFELKNERLRQRFTTADAGAHEILRKQARRLVVEMQSGARGLAARLRSHLSACGDTLPRAAEAAAALGLSERSLRRRLQDEGSSYRAVLDDTRLRKAERLLRDDRLPVEAIAQQLGYGEAAAFIHAFRRWTGSTPAAFRRGMTSAGRAG